MKDELGKILMHVNRMAVCLAEVTNENDAERHLRIAKIELAQIRALVGKLFDEAEA